MIQEITISEGIPTIYIPLVVIIIVTMLKDAFEDSKRHASDSQENSSKT